MHNNFEYLFSLAILKQLIESRLITQQEYMEIDKKNKQMFC